MSDHRASATSRITMFANIVSELMDEIFFVPLGFHSRLDDSLFLQVPAQSHPFVGAPSIEAVSGTGIAAPIGYGFGQPSTSVGSMEELDAPDQPDDDDGLTSSEFRLLAQQARDPELSPRDRSNAASMLICGVHGERSCHLGYSISHCSAQQVLRRLMHLKAWWALNWSGLGRELPFPSYISAYRPVSKSLLCCGSQGFLYIVHIFSIERQVCSFLDLQNLHRKEKDLTFVPL